MKKIKISKPKAVNRKQVTREQKSVLLSAFFIFFLTAFLITCSNPTESNKVTYSGTVTLADTTDYSGVTVSLYAPVELDTAIVRINKEYPNIGVQISQETEFDHRKHTPLYTTTTKADGSWEIKAEIGEYNIVAEKEGWGWRSSFQSNANNATNIKLYPIKILSGILRQNESFEENHFYELTGNVIIPDGVTYQFKKGMVFIAKPDAKLKIYGNVSWPDNGMVYFKEAQVDQSFWKGVEVHQAHSPIKNCFISNASTGISINTGNVTLSGIYLKNVKSTGISLTGIMPVTIYTSLLTGSITGIDINSVDSTVVIYNNIIAYQTDIGLLINESKIKIYNNYFYKNKIGISCQFSSNAGIHNNQIDYSESYGILLGGSNPTIKYNNFNNNGTSIQIPPTGYAGSSRPVINYDNFTNSEIHIYIYGTKPNPNKYDIDAKNNWWGTSIKANILTLLTDKSDLFEDSPGKYYTGAVLFDPYSFVKIAETGIQ